jgi:N-acetylglucosaminyldiphosphoundecaprenol N-acetyl-beta-D-mannosaminyltransferase
MSTILDVPVMIGIGAAFDYLAGVKPPAPTYLRHVGLEWVFRLAAEPTRLWRRYLRTNTTFVWLVLREGELR